MSFENLIIRKRRDERVIKPEKSNLHTFFFDRSLHNRENLSHDIRITFSVPAFRLEKFSKKWKINLEPFNIVIFIFNNTLLESLSFKFRISEIRGIIRMCCEWHLKAKFKQNIQIPKWRNIAETITYDSRYVRSFNSKSSIVGMSVEAVRFLFLSNPSLSITSAIIINKAINNI